MDPFPFEVKADDGRTLVVDQDERGRCTLTARGSRMKPLAFATFNDLQAISLVLELAASRLRRADDNGNDREKERAGQSA